MAHLTGAFEAYAAASWDAQMHLAELLGEHNWELDLDAGIARFSGRYTWPVQVLGTESFATRSWMWGWANTQSGIPPMVLQSSLRLKEAGQRYGIDELTRPTLELNTFDGHYLSLIARGVCEGDCYYRGPYEGGAVYMLLNVPEVRQRITPDPLRIIHVFTDLASQHTFTHRKALTYFLKTRKYAVVDAMTQLSATHPEGHRITATFDTRGRVTDLKSG